MLTSCGTASGWPMLRRRADANRAGRTGVARSLSYRSKVARRGGVLRSTLLLRLPMASGTRYPCDAYCRRVWTTCWLPVAVSAARMRRTAATALRRPPWQRAKPRGCALHWRAPAIVPPPDPRRRGAAGVAPSARDSMTRGLASQGTMMRSMVQPSTRSGSSRLPEPASHGASGCLPRPR
jgi:hypothetical protein